MRCVGVVTRVGLKVLPVFRKSAKSLGAFLCHTSWVLLVSTSMGLFSKTCLSFSFALTAEVIGFFNF